MVSLHAKNHTEIARPKDTNHTESPAGGCLGGVSSDQMLQITASLTDEQTVISWQEIQMACVHGCLLFPFPSQTLYCQFLEGRLFFWFTFFSVWRTVLGKHWVLNNYLLNEYKENANDWVPAGLWECNNPPLILLQFTTTMPGRHFNPLYKEENRKSWKIK